ncbi:hypothetical protein BDK51DRAFT_45381 [Blyttiomyces helicus]|uniref:Uncharacterized protein n=1 Tax=Blyttiomyces helicus TaxID=388810 RepID=A0A4P9WEY6_9FUNG|nr:hypothetical protein BDK51DRAFT_45381 [Blyttiomyces helicus]|eukprot:RKO90962.1 hypothetical protein BDK51DRAFT_45381 [Blyttiomyces helicus]
MIPTANRKPHNHKPHASGKNRILAMTNATEASNQKQSGKGGGNIGGNGGGGEKTARGMGKGAGSRVKQSDSKKGANGSKGAGGEKPAHWRISASSLAPLRTGLPPALPLSISWTFADPVNHQPTYYRTTEDDSEVIQPVTCLPTNPSANISIQLPITEQPSPIPNLCSPSAPSPPAASASAPLQKLRHLRRVVTGNASAPGPNRRGAAKGKGGGRAPSPGGVRVKVFWLGEDEGVEGEVLNTEAALASAREMLGSDDPEPRSVPECQLHPIGRTGSMLSKPNLVLMWGSVPVMEVSYIGKISMHLKTDL